MSLEESTRFPDSVKMNTELKMNCSYLAKRSESPAFTDMDHRNSGSLTATRLPSGARAAVLSREAGLEDEDRA